MQRIEKEALTNIVETYARRHDVCNVVTSPETDDDINTPVDWSADKVIADAMGRLSLKERERAYEDVHGISKAVDETPEMITDSMQKLRWELAIIESKPAYDIAMQHSEAFVTDHAFRLSFLRAECYNPSKAAARMVKYFDTKKELFGAEMLTKTITYADLDSYTQKVVARGSITILPTRDTLGRYIFVSATQHHLKELTTVANMGKAIWYMFSIIAEDEATQIKGCVVITYSIGPRLQPAEVSKKRWRAAMRVGGSIPMLPSSFHHCYDSTPLSPMLKIATVAGSKWFRVRMRAHQGSHSECQYKLMTFGIPVKHFPISTDGQLKSGKHKGWLQRRKQKENFMKTSSIQKGAVDVPFKFDVILGKGMPVQEHQGNKNLHELIALKYTEYDSAQRKRKTEIAEEVVQQIKKTSGRFLKRDDDSGMWVDVPSREAQDKVCHGFRRKREWDLKKAKSPIKSTTSRVAMTKIDKNDDNGQKRRKVSIDHLMM
ncbi:MAG: hypothetical protein SGBAC_006401 [Bacillariaceae sp.]